MNRTQLFEAALRNAGIDSDVRGTQSLTGGCIHEVMRLELASGRSVVAKIASAGEASLLEEERDGLRALHATNTVCVPEPLGVMRGDDASVLLTSYLAPGRASDDAWRAFGEALARLHAHEAGSRYGFDGDNHLGSTPQPNDWHDDWVEFNRRCRLGHQLALARRGNLSPRRLAFGELHAGEVKRIERVIERLDQLIPRSPRPALLHGDLWSGNAIPTSDRDGRARIGVIDPACSVGDGWADIAMTQLFGGFPQSCYEAYEANVTDRENVDTRIAVYQLYHVLNHVNIFGRGYAGQAMSIASALGA